MRLLKGSPYCVTTHCSLVCLLLQLVSRLSYRLKHIVTRLPRLLTLMSQLLCISGRSLEIPISIYPRPDIRYAYEMGNLRPSGKRVRNDRNRSIFQNPKTTIPIQIPKSLYRCSTRYWYCTGLWSSLTRTRSSPWLQYPLLLQ